ncbi:FitA-like ribbon-helix-helix domain-containing protein [Spirulina sp.]|uniref:FitA-like ribbon-helix-helix domain-containing protein n=1 Tax=Spirulina sp. TaxID=1157 RepID=UPI003F700997
MSEIILQNIDKTLLLRLQERAQKYGFSIEEMVTDILYHALLPQPPQNVNLALAIQQRFEPLGGFELPVILNVQRRLPL